MFALRHLPERADAMEGDVDEETALHVGVVYSQHRVRFDARAPWLLPNLAHADPGGDQRAQPRGRWFLPQR